MSSVTEVAVPTSDFDGNAPANGSRDMASTFSESLYWRRSARRYELLGLVSWMLAALSCVVFLAILLAARNLLLPGFALVPVACGLALVAASYLLTFALCRAATRRDMLEARWREERAGSVSEESHESA